MSAPDPGSVPEGVIAAFWDYERALMSNDLAALDRLFAPGPDTVRGDAGGLLVGHETISAFRRGRGGAPQRRILSVQVRPISPSAAVIIAIFEPTSGGRGQQTQVWMRKPGGQWTVSVAHVSAPVPAVNSTIWRSVGTPLVAGAAAGPLAGQTVAVKDLFSVEGFAIGGGVPEYLASAPVATASSSAVVALLDAGASVTGIARTDEFAFSIAGRNPHYGTPPNPAVVGGIPGGSSSGPASAVAMGQASIGLGTDTGGSIRVPASYQGLWGLRTTHGAVAVDGLLPLAPSFDTVGWLTRDGATLAAAAAATLDRSAQVGIVPRYLVSERLLAEVSGDVRAAFDAAISGLGAEQVDVVPGDIVPGDIEPVDIGDPSDLFEIYRVVQGAEAWRTHGDWISAHPGALGDEIGARFAWASTITEQQEADARARLAETRSRLNVVLGNGILLLPSASSAAPSATAAGAEIEAARAATMRLTCVAGLTGRPGLSVPLLDVEAGPVGLCLVGPRFSDLALIELALSDLGLNDLGRKRAANA